ncbi:hypothetical protein NL676_034400 [Syzygium grande]|nr:hypothetical protein NL676_034400 [Syzygium grande]
MGTGQGSNHASWVTWPRARQRPGFARPDGDGLDAHQWAQPRLSTQLGRWPGWSVSRLAYCVMAAARRRQRPAGQGLAVQPRQPRRQRRGRGEWLGAGGGEVEVAVIAAIVWVITTREAKLGGGGGVKGCRALRWCARAKPESVGTSSVVELGGSKLGRAARGGVETRP